MNHIDTSDFYGPHVTNQIIKEALHPYPENLVIVTKVGARRGADKSWIHDFSRQCLVDSVHDNLRNLGLDVLEVVNLRASGFAEPEGESIAEPMTILAGLQQQGLIRHLGVSNINPAQFAEGRQIAPVVCVQNFYKRRPTGRTTLSSTTWPRRASLTCRTSRWAASRRCNPRTLDTMAQSLNATPMQVAQAWLLHRSPNILLIPGTSSVAHLRENLKAASLDLPAEALAELDDIAAKSTTPKVLSLEPVAIG